MGEVIVIVIALALLLVWLRPRPQNRTSPPTSRSRVSRPPAQASVPEINEGERRVSTALRRRHPEWLLLDNVMLPSGPGTTQIDHILIAPQAVFVIETKDMNGWIFGGPGRQQWTQSYKAGWQAYRAGIRSRQFRFYNPLWQNEGHADTLVRLGIVDHWRALRPIVVFVGDAELKTADWVLPFDRHEAQACRSRTWRLRGVVCMGLAELGRYIDVSVKAATASDWSRQHMETIAVRVRNQAIPLTAASHKTHVEFVQSVKEGSGAGSGGNPS